MKSCTWRESSTGRRPMAAGVDPASLHPFHRLPAAAHLKDESGGTTIPIQVEQHSVRRSTRAELPRRAGASSISGGRSAEGPQAAGAVGRNPGGLRRRIRPHRRQLHGLLPFPSGPRPPPYAHTQHIGCIRLKLGVESFPRILPLRLVMSLNIKNEET